MKKVDVKAIPWPMYLWNCPAHQRPMDLWRTVQLYGLRNNSIRLDEASDTYMSNRATNKRHFTNYFVAMLFLVPSGESTEKVLKRQNNYFCIKENMELKWKQKPQHSTLSVVVNYSTCSLVVFHFKQTPALSPSNQGILDKRGHYRPVLSSNSNQLHFMKQESWFRPLPCTKAISKPRFS